MALAMDEQRWVKASAAKIMGDLQAATSLPGVGQRLLSGLVPLLGGGVAGLCLPEDSHARLRRIAGYGLAKTGDYSREFLMGEGLAGQYAKDRKVVALTNLPPDYIRIASGLGGSAPVQAVAWPLLSRRTLLGVLEVASFRAIHSRGQALLEELLPVVAMSLEVLQRNLGTRELLARSQEQTRQLEARTKELTQSQEELLAQQAVLTVQREQLEASEERFRLILESSAEGIFGKDVDGRITFVNAAACQMLGFKAE
jgi:two-component system, sensor histidine kinase and response regulator